MKHILNITYCILLACTVHAQNISVDNVHGLVEYNNGTEWLRLTDGQQLADQTKLRFINSSCLAYKKGAGSKYYCYEGPKEVVLDLKSFEKESFFDRIVNGLTVYFGDPSSKRPPIDYKSGGYLMLLPADGELLLDNTFDFIWENDENNSYKFSLLQNGNEKKWLCVEALTSNNIINSSANNICSKTYNIGVGHKYLWTVRPSFDQTQKSYFVEFGFADATDKKRLKEAISELEHKRSCFSADVFEVMKADIYYRLKMYTEAWLILNNAKVKYANSSLVRTGMETLSKDLNYRNQRR